jgi:DNA-binding MarR family transcriptional regulator
MDVVNDQAKQMASAIYEEACGVSLRELRVLRLANGRPGITQGEVSSLARLEKTLVSKLVTALARRDLLVRKIGTEDARWVQLHLTAEGREVRPSRPEDGEVAAGGAQQQGGRNVRGLPGQADRARRIRRGSAGSQGFPLIVPVTYLPFVFSL